MKLIVQAVDDVQVRIIEAPKELKKFEGWFLYLPNSVRRDVRMILSGLPTDAVRREKWGKEPQQRKEARK